MSLIRWLVWWPAFLLLGPAIILDQLYAISERLRRIEDNIYLLSEVLRDGRE